MFRPRRSLLATLAAGVLLTLSGGVAAAHQQRDVGGHVYVNDNTVGHNTISAFDRHADGSLTELAGSPFRTGGVGTGAGVATQGALQRSSDGRFLLAVDPGSDQISVMRIRHDGSLKLVDTAGSHGKTPGSLAVHGRLVYVANTGIGGMNYTGFRLQHDGQLSHLRGSTYALPDDAFPGQILFSADGRHVAGIRTGGTPTAPTIGPSLIDSFQVGWFGRLIPAAGSPFASQRVGPIGAEFSPTHPNQLFVTNAHDGPTNGSVSAYHVGQLGKVAAIDGSPFTNGQTATCWIEISTNGRYAFVVNTATPSMTSYSIATNGQLTVIGSIPFKGAGAPVDARLDPAGKYLYVVDSKLPKIHAFSVQEGTLTELPGSPFANPSAGAAFGIVTD